MTTWASAREHFVLIGYRLPVEGSTAWQRFPAAGKPERNRSAGARLTDDYRAVLLVDHVVGYRGSYQHHADRPFDPADWKRAREDAERRRVEREAENARRRRGALEGLARTLAASVPGDGHDYVIGKGLVHAHGARRVGDALYVVGQDERGADAFGQRIDRHGDKRLVAGTSFMGAWVTFGTPVNGERIIIGTGWATSATVFEESGTPTLAAMCDTNLRRVAEAARRLWPDSPLVIAGDDDRHNATNGGREAAEAAARATDALVLFPTFCRADCRCSDFADVRACRRREGSS